ncbi:hypothetical protein BLNAU_14174 [Blattamonas nauphoetae]|uniref:Uncharacterized protein n=1 Tax=Blattamonas nauphoetae TaxID=2049346 RepID=A0ABQ9XEH8_9EUKA|nr:hypothetical protein BLNAU_14174 [Blattamonas nauphoetae]
MVSIKTPKIGTPVRIELVGIRYRHNVAMLQDEFTDTPNNSETEAQTPPQPSFVWETLATPKSTVKKDRALIESTVHSPNLPIVLDNRWVNLSVKANIQFMQWNRRTGFLDLL